MIGCLISLLIVVILALIFVFAIEQIVGVFLQMPAQVWMLIRLLVGLLVLLYALNCLGFVDGGGYLPRYVR
jgi:hypothetical protein